MPTDIAIDIGTSYTSLFVRGAGVVLREPSVVAVSGTKNKVKAVGFDAVEMMGKNPDNVRVLFPVKDGYIADTQGASLMLRKFLEKITPPNALFYPRFKGVLAAPTGLAPEERVKYEQVCNTAGCGEVTMADSILMSGLGINLPIERAFGGLVVDIGGGITQIASISMCGVLSGCAVGINGEMMDKALSDFILGKYRCRVGLKTLRKIKTDIGSLFENDTATTTVSGVDAASKELKTFVITAADVGEALRVYYSKIADSIERVINKCPPEAAAEIHRSGIHITGGAAAIRGLEAFMSRKLKLAVSVPHYPHLATITGAGKVLTDRDLLAEIIKSKK